METITTIGLDIAKSVFQAHGVSSRGEVVVRRRLSRGRNGLKDWEKPEVINTDKAPTYASAELKAEGKCPEATLHRQVKYLNNVVEADHGKSWRLSAC